MGVIWIAEKGNTLWKVAIFQDGEITSKVTFTQLTSEALPSEAPSEILLTGSGGWSEEEEAVLYSICSGNLVIFRHGDSHPLQSEVHEATSLGTDRIANSYAVAQQLEGYMINSNAWLVIDVGTCVTADLVVDGKHRGGSISPGIQMRLNSMHSGTNALPEVEQNSGDERIQSSTLGLTTKDAMLKGAAGGVVSEIVGRWIRLRVDFPSLGIILTGGGSSHLELGPVIPKFADSNLTLKGYYAILQHIKSA
jgi:type III pantothenate kinase